MNAAALPGPLGRRRVSAGHQAPPQGHCRAGQTGALSASPQAIAGLTKLDTYYVACQRSLYDFTLTWDPVVIPKGFFNNLPGCVRRGAVYHVEQTGSLLLLASLHSRLISRPPWVCECGERRPYNQERPPFTKIKRPFPGSPSFFSVITPTRLSSRTGACWRARQTLCTFGCVAA